MDHKKRTKKEDEVTRSGDEGLFGTALSESDDNRSEESFRSSTKPDWTLENFPNCVKFDLQGGMTPKKTMMLIYLSPEYVVTGRQLVLFKLFTVSTCVECIYLNKYSWFFNRTLPSPVLSLSQLEPRVLRIGVCRHLITALWSNCIFDTRTHFTNCISQQMRHPLKKRSGGPESPFPFCCQVECASLLSLGGFVTRVIADNHV